MDEKETSLYEFDDKNHKPEAPKSKKRKIIVRKTFISISGKAKYNLLEKMRSHFQTMTKLANEKREQQKLEHELKIKILKRKERFYRLKADRLQASFVGNHGYDSYSDEF